MDTGIFIYFKILYFGPSPQYLSTSHKIYTNSEVHDGHYEISGEYKLCLREDIVL